MLNVTDKLNTKEEIKRLFYEEHKRPTDIAENLRVGKSYVTKVIQKDIRYTEEKETRKNQSKEKHKISKRQYIQNRRQNEKQDYQELLKQIAKDNIYLSTKKKLSDLDFVKWNRGMFEYAKSNSDLVLKNGINVGYNVPKRIKNVVNASSIKRKRIYV